MRDDDLFEKLDSSMNIKSTSKSAEDNLFCSLEDSISLKDSFKEDDLFDKLETEIKQEKKPEPAPETKAEEKKPEPAPETKAEEKKPEPAPEPKAEEKKPEPAPEPKAEEKKPEPEPKAEEKKPEPEPEPKAEEKKPEPEPKAEEKEPEPKAEEKKPEPEPKVEEKEPEPAPETKAEEPEPEVKAEEKESKKTPTAERPEGCIPTAKIGKMFPAELGQGLDMMSTYIFVMTISEKNMVFTSDIELPRDEELRVVFKFTPSNSLDISFLIDNSSKMTGGTIKYEVDYIDLCPKTRDFLKTYIETNAISCSGKSAKMNYQLSIEVEKDGKMQRCKTLVTEFGTKGMNITHDFSMPQPKEFKVGLFLENQFAPVTVKAKVVNQKKSSFGKYLIDLQFLNVLPIIEKKLSGFIDKAASGKLEKKVFTEIPLEVFNTTIKRYDETPENVDAFRG